MTLAERQSTYRALCEDGHERALFMQPWWLDATGSWDVALAYRNERLVGAMPYAPSRSWGVSRIGMPALTHHLRIWMDKPPDISAHKWLTREKQIIWSLVDALPTFGFFSLVFESDSFDNWLPFHWKGFRQEVRYTFVIDRQAPDELDQHINRNLRRNLREAAGQVTIRPAEDLQSAFQLFERTHARQRIKMPFTPAHLTTIDTAVRSNDAGTLLGAFDEQDRMVSAAYVLWDQDRAYYFLAGDADAGRESGAGIALCREALHIAFEERQVGMFDFCGSMLEPVTEIRRQFGARSVPLMKIYKAGYKWLDALYALTR